MRIKSDSLERSHEFSSKKIQKVIKALIRDEIPGDLNISAWKRILMLCGFIGYITDNHILDEVIQYLEDIEFFIIDEPINKKLSQIKPNKQYSIEDCTIIKSFIISDLFISKCYLVYCTSWKCQW